MITAGMSTFATAIAAPVRTVPTHSGARPASIDRITVAVSSTTSATSIVRFMPKRWLIEDAIGETIAYISIGSAASSPSAVGSSPVSPPIWSMRAPTPCTVVRRFAATTMTVTTSSQKLARRDSCCTIAAPRLLHPASTRPKSVRPRGADAALSPERTGCSAPRRERGRPPP